MAMAAANCYFSVLTSSTVSTSRCSLTSQCLFSTFRRPTYFLTSIVKSSKDRNQNPKQKLPRKKPGKFSKESEAITQKFPGISRDESLLSNADGQSSRKKAGRSRSTLSRSSGMQRKGSEGVLFDSKDQQVDTGNLQDAAFLNAVVKVYCTHTAPDYSLPWQKQRQYQSTGSAFMIGDGKLLTNAHCVEHDTQLFFDF